MRVIIRTIGAKLAIVAAIAATLAIVPVMATSGGPAGTGAGTMTMPQERGNPTTSSTHNAKSGSPLASIDPRTWRSLGTYSGGEVISETVSSVMGDNESDWFDDHGQGDQLDKDF